MKQFGESNDPNASTVFVQQTAQLVVDAVRQNLADPHASTEAIDKIAGMVARTYQTSEANRAQYIADGTASTLKRKIETMLPEDERAAYAERTLKARAALGGDNVSMAANDLYELIK
jgi:HEPN domain-containing protein